VNKDGLHRHYDRLTPGERFRLDVLAMARGDMQESERLVSSCPRASYTMTERGFGARWGGAENATLRVWIALGEDLTRLRMVDTLRVMFPYQQTLSSNITFDAYFKGHESGSRHAWGHAGKCGPPPFIADLLQDAEYEVRRTPPPRASGEQGQIRRLFRLVFYTDPGVFIGLRARI
jgi:hypothetical protein